MFRSEDPYIKRQQDSAGRTPSFKRLVLNWWSILWKEICGRWYCHWVGLFLGRRSGISSWSGVAKVTKSNRVQENILISSGGRCRSSDTAFNAPIAGFAFCLKRFTIADRRSLATLTATVTADFISYMFWYHIQQFR